MTIEAKKKAGVNGSLSNGRQRGERGTLHKTKVKSTEH